MTAKSLKHKFTSGIADGGDATVVQPSNWNDEHNLTLGYRSVTGTTDTIADADTFSLIVYNNASGVAASLPAPSGGLFALGWYARLQNAGLGTVTLTPGSTINGSVAAVTLAQGDVLDLHGTGTADFRGVKIPTPVAPPSGKGAPGGRPTLTSGVPILIANAINQGTVYYTPYLSDVIPIFDGTNWNARTFTEQSVVLDATNFLSGRLYDFFMFNNAGVPTLGYGPAWTSNTARSAAIARLNGLWTNSATITLRVNSTTTFSVPANQATAVMTVRATANGQTGMNLLPAAAAGGNANVLGVFSFYNRVRFIATSRDNTASWNYLGTAWRAANGNANNSISFVDGLGEVYINAAYAVGCTNTSGQPAAVGINLNSTSATPALQGAAQASGGTGSINMSAGLLPALGYNTVTAMENATAANCTFYGSGLGAPFGQTQGLQVDVMI